MLRSASKRAAEDPHAPPVPLKRRSVEIDPQLRAEWRSAEQWQAANCPSGSLSAQPLAAVDVDLCALTAADWSCAHELNALFSANSDKFPSIVVRSRTTFTRASTAAVAAKIAASPTGAAASWETSCGGARSAPQLLQRSRQHLALAAHVLSVAFAPFPTAALSLYEIEAPAWLSGWAGTWCPAAAPATPPLGSRSASPAAAGDSGPSAGSCFVNGSSSSDSSSSGSYGTVAAAVVVKLMALHGYADGQPACGQGAGLGEAPQKKAGGRPARTVFLPIW